MCLAYFYWNPLTRTLMIASNRDEVYSRKTDPMHWWDNQEILAGKDCISGGTWLAIGANGKIALITNMRGDDGSLISEPVIATSMRRSRGLLAVDFITSSKDAHDFIHELQDEVCRNSELYAGFNLVIFDSLTILNPQGWWFNNVTHQLHMIEPGYHGISNATLDAPWPKITTGLPRFIHYVEQGCPLEEYLSLLMDATPADEYLVPDNFDNTISQEIRALSAKFVQLDHYGTRSSTIISVRGEHKGCTQASALYCTHIPKEQAVIQKFCFSLPGKTHKKIP